MGPKKKAVASSSKTSKVTKSRKPSSTRTNINSRATNSNLRSNVSKTKGNSEIIPFSAIKPGWVNSAIQVRFEKLKTFTKPDKVTYRFLFGDGKAKGKFITGLAFDDNGRKISDRLQESQLYIIQGSIMAKKKSRQRVHKSLSNSDCDIFLNSSTQIEEVPESTPAFTNNIKTVLDEMQRGNPFKTILKAVTIEDGTVYRYWGCQECTTAMRFPSPDGAHRCKKASCSNKNGKKGRQICTIIKDLRLKDSSGEISGLVCFNKICKQILGIEEQNAHYPDSDTRIAFEALIGARVNIDLNAMKVSGQVHLQVHGIVVVEKRPVHVNPALVFEEYNDSGEADEAIEQFSRLTLTIEPSARNTNTNGLLTEKDGPYKLSSRPPGLALVINNRNFKSPKLERIGSEIDVYNIEHTLDQLNYQLFQNKVFEDVKSYEIADIIEDFKDELLDADIDSCIVIIMSHGAQNTVLMSDPSEDKAINIWKSVIYEFSEDNFPEFQGKPKMFFINACQSFGTTKELHDSFENTIMSDILVCFPALPGHLAKRNDKTGSRFIYLLCEGLLQHAGSHHLEKILKLVQARMLSYYLKNKTTKKINMQTCVYESVIFAEFKFPVFTQGQEQMPELLDEDEQ